MTENLYELMSNFKASRNGLLTPEGELIVVSFYNHFNELAKYSDFKEDIENFKERVGDAEQDFIDSIPPGEHPGWHGFECWRYGEEDNLRQEILQKAYDLGWGRLGLAMKRPKPHLLELETSGKNLAKLKKSAKDIAEMVNAELFVHNVDHFK